MGQCRENKLTVVNEKDKHVTRAFPVASEVMTVLLVPTEINSFGSKANDKGAAQLRVICTHYAAPISRPSLSRNLIEVSGRVSHGKRRDDRAEISKVGLGKRKKEGMPI